ncbi:unnamed protein product [Urochloa decumbens]|uniref:E2 ubiquitin-conjugating enzyme n=1 Tax=Urochloa decumbens TaxID=240449 RepID=A0ABC9GCW4_9POAL
MEDAMGQTIRWRDLVVFNPSAGAHLDRGLVLKRKPGPNKVAVQRLDGAEVTLNAGDVIVVDRSYLRAGMAVASASPDLGGGQVGVVTGAATALDVVRLDGAGAGEEEHAPAAVLVATAVPPGDLRRVREFCLGDYVVSGPWLGRVFEVSLDVDVMFGDGGAAVCRVARAGSKLWTLNKDSLNRHTNSVFYPGQRVGGSLRDLRAARWLKGDWKPSYLEGTVSRVDTAAVLVYWLASSASPAPPPPPHQQSPRDLTFFCSGETNYGFWGVGDRCFFRAPAAGDVPRRDRAALTTRHWNRRRLKPPPLGEKRDRRRAAELEQSMSVVSGTRTAVDVVWQDGTRQRGVPSVSLVQFVARRDQDFFPGERVVAGTTAAVDVHGGGDDTARLEARVGVVRSLSYKDQMVRVSWFKAAAERAGEEHVEIDCHETLSAYDLRRGNSCRDPFYGDFVVRRSNIVGDAGGNKEKYAGGGGNDLSWVGHIVDLCCDDAHVQVKWGDGKTSKVLLHEIAVVKHQCVGDMLREIGDWVHEDGDTNNANDSSKPQETAAIINNGNDSEGDDDSGSESDDEDGHAAMRRPAGWVGVVTQAVIRLAGKVLAQGRRYLLNGSEGSSSEFAATENTMPGGDGDAKEASTMKGKAEADATSDDKSFNFSRFDVVQSPLDHHYLDNMERDTGGGRKWTKRVQKEWKILENNLPDSIYVRAYEDRMDLLRVVMVGASGTPYHDGLFFFDLQLPPSYPAAPPLVNYRSFGLRVNPNLYPSGTVCLSLLNTFGGQGTELWSPEASSVLQVVVSIQGLVLNAQPYYNEAGYAAQAGTPVGRRNELPYSENACLLTLQTMLHLLRRPPAGFEDFVRDHFRRRGQHVLRACEAYLDGSPVGTLDAEARAMEGMSKERQPCSAGFKLALLNVMPRLVEAFAGMGAQGRCE